MSRASITPSSSSSSKRKLDDYTSSSSSDDDDDYTYSNENLSTLVRMKKDDSTLSSAASSVRHSSSSNCTSSNSNSSSSSCFSGNFSNFDRLQFFVKMINKGQSLVIQANRNDTVRSIHERLCSITGIPVIEQRLIYRGKQLQCEQTLSQCGIQNDSGLQLVGRMRSTEHPEAWQRIDDMVSTIWRVCRGESDIKYLKHVKSQLHDFLQKTPKNDCESAASHIQIFVSSSAPAALVMLYVSSVKGNKDCGEDSIKYFIDTCRNFPKPIHAQFAPIVLDFCKLLSRTKNEDPLYLFCRSTLGSLVENVGVVRSGSSLDEGNKGLIALREIFPFVSELASRLSKDLVLSMELPLSLGPVGPLPTDVQDFTAFLVPLRIAVMEQVGLQGPVSVPIQKGRYKHPRYGEEIEFLHVIYADLLGKMETCLQRVEDCLASGESAVYQSGWSHYLAILKELNGISKLYKGEEEHCQTIIRLRKIALRALIVQFAKRTEDSQWLLEYKDILDFESRRHLAMLMFPDVKEDYEELHEMLIDRSQLLPESFEYIARADPEALHAGLFMEFKNEEATGPGVLREWFFLVCKAIFNTQNALFVACPNDRRRFFPNHASKVEDLHLEYFGFAGRVIALALMHKVHVGIVLDRVFFLQLAGMPITLEDIKDADPLLYYSCKQILEMDADFIDSDALGLTFVTEVEELGSRKIVELCTDGKNQIVTSRNRLEYVDLLIHNRFVKSTFEQVSRFAQGFADIISSSRLQKLFFQGLELEDFDRMLHGSESDISVEDWRAHTDYNGYKETDPQISWFWKIVGEMSAEQRRVLLFFWTSIKFLPVEGFGGLASRLYLYNSPGPHDRLPASHTCFYRLCVPRYPSMKVMQDRLRIITQEHVGCSFGTW